MIISEMTKQLATFRPPNLINYPRILQNLPRIPIRGSRRQTPPKKTIIKPGGDSQVKYKISKKNPRVLSTKSRHFVPQSCQKRRHLVPQSCQKNGQLWGTNQRV